LKWQSNAGNGYLLVLIGEIHMSGPLLGDKQCFLAAVV
jgi:hypothetical protein